MTNDFNVSFEYTVDEAVSLQLDFIKSTKEGSSWRNREQWKFGVSFMFIVAFLLIFLSSDRSLGVVAALIGFAVVIGVFVTVLFGRYYDHLAQTRIRRLMIEQIGGPGPYMCSIEIRPEGLWVAQPSVELTFPWRDARNIEDVPEGINMTFAGGRVLARSRGFTSQAHRASFLDGIRKHVSAASAGAGPNPAA